MKLVALLSLVFGFTFFSSIQVSYAGALDWDCNPRAQCRRCVLGVCADEPICVSVRAVCRQKCGPINDDANRYISESRRMISGKETVLAGFAESISLNNDKLKTSRDSYEYLRSSKNQLNVFLVEQLISEEKKEAFLEQLREVLKTSITQGIEYTNAISQLNLNATDSKALETTVKAYGSNLQEMYNLLQKIPDSSALMSVFVWVDNVLEKQMQSSEMDIAGMEVEIKSLQAKIENLKIEIQSQQNFIKQQEARKCPSGGF